MTEPLPPGLHADVSAAPVSDIDLDRAIVSRLGLYGFLQVAWPLIEPGVKYSDNWHTYQVCGHLDAVSPARILVNGLVINVPPGTGKSAVTCVAWPAHTWIWDPAHVWLFVSYSASLSNRDARRCKELVDSRWFQDRWPHVRTTGNKMGDYWTTAGGRRLSTSSEGQITGLVHAHTRVVDDPIKPLDVMGTAAITRSAIDKVNKDIWEGTLSTRVKDPNQPAFALIMQRLHDEDLAGYILRTKPEVTHLRFPMRYESKTPCKTSITLGNGTPGGDPRTKDGELLWPGRFDEKAVASLESSLNVFAAAQLQQRPSAAAGQVIKRFWIRYWDNRISVPVQQDGKWIFPFPAETLDEYIQSWDCTFKETSGSDYVCGQLWGKKPGSFYLLDRVYERMNFPNTVTAIQSMTRKYPHALAKLVEDKANGPAVIAWLEGKVPGLIPIEPYGSKLARLNGVSPMHRAGNVYYPNPDMPGYGWVSEHVEDVVGFPMRRFDDTVDAESQALDYFRGQSNPWLEGLSAQA